MGIYDNNLPAYAALIFAPTRTSHAVSSSQSRQPMKERHKKQRKNQSNEGRIKTNIKDNGERDRMTREE
jgi:hypothetical protein